MSGEKIYILIPRTVDSAKPPYKFTMTCGRAMAHAAHVAAVLERACAVRVADKDVVVLSVASSEELLHFKNGMDRQGIGYVEYVDEDRAFEGSLLTAIATMPLITEQQSLFRRLAAWRCKCNEILFPRSSTVEHSVLTEGMNAGRIPGEPIP